MTPQPARITRVDLRMIGAGPEGPAYVIALCSIDAITKSDGGLCDQRLVIGVPLGARWLESPLPEIDAAARTALPQLLRKWADELEAH